MCPTRAGPPPCHPLRCTALCKALAGPFPALRFCPTGGVSGENMDQWFAAGATCVGIGSSMFSRAAIKDRNQKLLVEEAKHHLSLLSLISR